MVKVPNFEVNVCMLLLRCFYVLFTLSTVSDHISVPTCMDGFEKLTIQIVAELRGCIGPV